MSFTREPVRAPELRGVEWLNSPMALSLSGLRGKLVLLDFWTSGCINCLHVLEDLAYLERKYAGRPFVVLGIHTPKFAHEHDLMTVRDSIARNGVNHPVLLDNERRTWDAYAVKGWPTLVLIDPNGYILGQVAGEGHRAELDAAIADALDTTSGGSVSLPDADLPHAIDAASDVRPLRYPGKVLAGADADALFIADTGHHRLVWATLDGTLVDTIGSGTAGAEDGDFATASFRAPQGMALDRQKRVLYVADTGNHVIRRLDLVDRSVSTVAGTGELGYHFDGRGSARDVPLNSPWDVCLLGESLYIAMAGLHEIWSYQPELEAVSVVAGTGAEGRADGPAASAVFAQPSGLATDGERLFVADAESSCVRMLTFDAGGGVVSTLAGGDLFLFGDSDGVGDEARFQHPSGLAWLPGSFADGPGALYIADTYNSRIRRLDPATRAVTTVPITLAPEASFGEARLALREPGGLAYAGGNVYIADTDNHAIHVVGVSGGPAWTLTFAGLCPPGLCLPA